jgi:hypothetical protein
MRQVVFTLDSLQVLIEESPVVHSMLSGSQASSQDVLAVEIDDTLYVLHKKDKVDARRIIVLLRNGRMWPKEVNQAEQHILERMYQLGQLAGRENVWIPPAWAPQSHKYNNLLEFHACEREFSQITLRWIAEIQQNPPHDVCYWQLTVGAQKERLEKYSAFENEYAAAIASWPSAYTRARAVFHERAPLAELPGAGVDLPVSDFPAGVTQKLSRHEWQSRLTPQQLDFISLPVNHAIKLRGPAGTGKTLTLELKALHEIDKARKHGESRRILFVTHSWALAEEVDVDIRFLSEWGPPDELTVMPLLTLAQYILPAERQNPFALVGEDSLSGKKAELERIDDALEEFLNGDWVSFRDEVSLPLRSRLESADPADRSSFIWDCMIEFDCVLGADGIFPVFGAEARYLKLPRISWMMPLPEAADKRLILNLYRRYMAKLESSEQCTTGQYVNDFLNYLETNAWNVRRVKDGYDLVFVDEFHLFNFQERQLLRYLTRSRGDFPKILMALDPKQSPWGVYAQLKDADPSSRPDRIEDEFGKVSSVDLATVHRFSPEILQLVKNLDRQFPNLDLGADWGPGMAAMTSSAENGPMPILVRSGSQPAEVSDVLEELRSHKASGVGGQLAVAIVDQGKFGSFQAMAAGFSRNTGTKVSIIATRDDVEGAQYRRRGILMGPAEYLAGLQFDSVIVAGLPDSGTGFANLGYRRMRFLSLLYLAITRARREVRIFVNDDYGGVPDVLQVAANNGYVILQRGRTLS